VLALQYCKQEDWEERIVKSQDAEQATRKTAMNYLRKFDAAGRIMETDEGTAAPSPCSWCTREGHKQPCRVWATREDKACAYCKRHAKAECRAKDVKVEVVTTKDRVSTVEERLTKLDSNMAALREETTTVKERLTAVEERMTKLDRLELETLRKDLSWQYTQGRQLEEKEFELRRRVKDHRNQTIGWRNEAVRWRNEEVEWQNEADDLEERFEEHLKELRQGNTDMRQRVQDLTTSLNVWKAMIASLNDFCSLLNSTTDGLKRFLNIPIEYYGVGTVEQARAYLANRQSEREHDIEAALTTANEHANPVVAQDITSALAAASLTDAARAENDVALDQAVSVGTYDTDGVDRRAALESNVEEGEAIEGNRTAEVAREAMDTTE